jgi:hypothetical protein
MEIMVGEGAFSGSDPADRRRGIVAPSSALTSEFLDLLLSRCDHSFIQIRQ